MDRSEALRILRNAGRLLDLHARATEAPEVVEAAGFLTGAVQSEPSDLEVLHALGWWHEARSQTLTIDPEAREAEEEEALTLLYPVYLADPHRVPGRVASTISGWATKAGDWAAQELAAHRHGQASVDLIDVIRAAQAAVDATPTAHEDKPAYFLLLASALHARYKETGDPADRDEAIRLARRADAIPPADHPDRPLRSSTLARALYARFDESGNTEDREEAIRLSRQAFNAASNPPLRSEFLTTLVAMLQLRHEQTGDLADLNEIIRLSRQAIETTPPDPAWLDHLSTLGIGLATRFELTDSLADLDEAIRLMRAALTAAPEDDQAWPGRASNLSGALVTRYKRVGAQEDLDEAVRTGRSAVNAAVEDRENRAKHQNNLMVVLRTRYERDGTPEDLDEAIALGREATASAPAGHDDRSSGVLNLASALITRYYRIGAIADVEDALTLARQGREAAPPGHPSHWVYLTVTADALVARYRRGNGEPHDLNHAVNLLHTALSSFPIGHTGRATCLSNLAAALHVRYGEAQDLDDLDTAIDKQRQALDATPDRHTERPGRLSNLAIWLLTRYTRTGSQADLEYAIESGFRAIATPPANHPENAGLMSNLGLLLWIRFERTESATDQLQALELFRRAAWSETTNPGTACIAAARLGRRLEGDQAIEAFARALELLPKVAARWLRFDDAIPQLERMARVGRDAAAAYLSVGNTQAALEALEHSRAVIFSRVLQSRGERRDLHAAHPALAKQLENAFAAFDLPNASRAASAALDAALTEVRRLPGWERYLLPPTALEIATAAGKGPIVLVNVAWRRCDALIVTPEDVTPLALSGLTEERAAAETRRFLNAVSRLSGQGSNQVDHLLAEKDISEICAWLWDTVACPILNQLGYTQPRSDRDFASWPRVWWIPTGPLALLPLQAAGHHVDTAGRGRVNRDDTVIDRVVSSTIPTIRSLAHARSIRGPTGGAKRILAVAMPHTSSTSGTDLPDLPGARDEIDRLKTVLYDTQVTELADFIAVESSPTKPRVLTELPGHAWAHFACHAYTDPDHPTHSTLLLADHETDPFTVLDLTSVQLPEAELVYLSCCTTARTPLESPDEPIHFAAAAVLAGYRHVVATLWPILDDPEPADLIYRGLTTQGRPTDWTSPRAAIVVHRATHHLRNTHGTHIYRWASLTHHGP